MEIEHAEALAIELMRVFKLNDWMFEYTTDMRVFGRCDYQRKSIQLSKMLTYLNSVEQVKDTILHEIAHALCPGDGHGQQWKYVAKRIGCTPMACYGREVRTRK